MPRRDTPWPASSTAPCGRTPPDRRAVRSARRHRPSDRPGREYGIDPDRIALWGESAGGYLASMVGLTDSRVRAVVDEFGASDLSASAEGFDQRMHAALADPRHPIRRYRAAETNPIDLVRPAPRRSCSCTVTTTASSRQPRRSRCTGRSAPPARTAPTTCSPGRPREDGAQPPPGTAVDLRPGHDPHHGLPRPSPAELTCRLHTSPSPSPSSRSRPPPPTSCAPCRSPASSDAPPRLRQQPALPGRLRRGRRPARRHHRPGPLAQLPFTTQGGPAPRYPFGMFAVPRERIARIHASSGTTGQPTVVGYTAEDLRTWATVMARSLRAAGARPGHLLHNATATACSPAASACTPAPRQLGCTVVPVSGGMTERQVRLIADFQPGHHHRHPDLHARHRRRDATPGHRPAQPRR